MRLRKVKEVARWEVVLRLSSLRFHYTANRHRASSYSCVDRNFGLTDISTKPVESGSVNISGVAALGADKDTEKGDFCSGRDGLPCHVPVQRPSPTTTHSNPTNLSYIYIETDAAKRVSTYTTACACLVCHVRVLLCIA